jgi:hypothetical protein
LGCQQTGSQRIVASTSIVRTESPEEREYARYLREIEARKALAAQLSADLEVLKLALGQFDAEYHAKIGVLFIELDRIELAISEYEYRIVLLQEQPDVDARTVEEDVAQRFDQRRESIRFDEETTQQYEEVHRRNQKRPELTEASTAELRQLYRDLARKFHPDLARTDDERRKREVIMQRINAAFQDRDHMQLEALACETEFEDPKFERRSLGEKLIWAIREVARLDEMVAVLQREDGEIRKTPTYELWSRFQAGEPVFERLEVDISSQLADRRERLTVLVGTYRHLIDGQLS